MKLYDKKEALPIALIVIIAIAGWYFYPLLPDLIPSHWNVYGEVDGWMNKSFAIWFFPVLIAALYALLSVVPVMDPLRANIRLFSHLYFWFKVVFVLFMGSLYLMTIWAGLGHELNVGQLVMWGVAILFFFLGLMMPQIKKNYTIGIRLPWTLHSEKVWDKTHKFGGQLFVALAILMVLVSFLKGACAFWILIGGIILLMLTLVIYSYWEYRKIEKSA